MWAHRIHDFVENRSGHECWNILKTLFLWENQNFFLRCKDSNERFVGNSWVPHWLFQLTVSSQKNSTISIDSIWVRAGKSNENIQTKVAEKRSKWKFRYQNAYIICHWPLTHLADVKCRFFIVQYRVPPHQMDYSISVHFESHKPMRIVFLIIIESKTHFHWKAKSMNFCC